MNAQSCPMEEGPLNENHQRFPYIDDNHHSEGKGFHSIVILIVIGDDQAPSEARGVVIGGPEYVKSCRVSLIDSKMAGPIAMKLSDIDQGNSVHVLGPKN